VTDFVQTNKHGGEGKKIPPPQTYIHIEKHKKKFTQTKQEKPNRKNQTGKTNIRAKIHTHTKTFQTK